MAARLLRTLLFTPGDNARRMAGAIASNADAVVLDLEDAVTPSSKDAARNQVRQILALPNDGRTYVRINAVGSSEYNADLAALGSTICNAAAIVVPKVESVDELRTLDDALRRLESNGTAQSPPPDIIAVLESSAGILAAQSIAQCPGVSRLIFGTLDLAAELGVSPSTHGREFLHARSHLVLASRAAGLPGPLDGPHTRVDDNEGLSESARSARDLGFSGKVVIHPAQIDAVHQAYAPSEAQVAHAHRIIDAYRNAQANNIGAVKLDDGTFIDRPVVVSAAVLLGLTLEEVQL